MKPGADVLLGFEVGAGAEVRIPVRHLAITGQTQEAGKTTALEALISRSGLRAITFITKRGEASFASARRIQPYFREQADWQFVASILEASRGEKLKFERSWIIRASKGARTLADVHANVKKSMETAKGLSGDVYLTLDAYLEVVVPAVGKVQWAASVSLEPGVNVMDLTDIPDELQHLVIKSSIDWVLQREHDTVVVIPEAWKFLPQGRGTPVKRAADALIRQGAGLRNYVWLDSQDLGGIEKEILRHVPVWVLGVQREANEIKRTLSNIPDGIAKPTKAAIATLELGQFIACWGKHAIKTYVQPTWLSDSQAADVAVRGIPAPPAPPAATPKENAVNETEVRELREENARLRTANSELHRRLAALEPLTDPAPGVPPGLAPGAPAAERPIQPPARATPPREFTAQESFGNEALYQAIKTRLVAEAPALIRMLVTKPEIEMTVTRRTIQVDESSLKGRIARLLKEGFFSEPKGPSSVRTALKRTGPDANTANIGRALDDYTRDGFVTDEGSGYRSVEGMKVNIVGEKTA